jgi:ABC-2 type transport system ATP-binding protein
MIAVDVAAPVTIAARVLPGRRTAHSMPEIGWPRTPIVPVTITEQTISHREGDVVASSQDVAHSPLPKRCRYSRAMTADRVSRYARSETIPQVHPRQFTDTAPAASPTLSFPEEPIIAARGIVKRYGETLAVDGLDLTIWPGEIFGILGPNGAGKTTTLEILEGLRAPDSGDVRVAGFDPVTEPERVHRVIGVQLQTTALFDYLNCAEIIALFAALYSADRSSARIDALLALVGLEEKRRSRVNDLSGGQKQRLAIALALVNTPRVAFLDEPTTGLDPAARRALWQTVRDIRAGGATVVITTHYMEEAEELCDRIAIMDRGRIVACDTPRALILALGAEATVRADVEGSRLTLEQLRALDGVASADLRADNGRESLALRTSDAQATLIALLELTRSLDVPLTGLESAQATLEDVFLARTGHDYEDDEKQ